MIASTAVSLLLRKSGVRISIVVPGVLRLRASITLTNCDAPPSAKSSRSTLVTTICSSPSSAAAVATCSGSSGSTARGMPVLTLQKAQARVQVSPRIITVACFLVQHSPMFGHAASSHTVARLSSRISLRVWWYPSLTGALTRIQSGLRCFPPTKLGTGETAAGALIEREIATVPAACHPCPPTASAPFVTYLSQLIEGYRRFRAEDWARERERWSELAE